MTEKEKGKAGLFYNPNYDSELTVGKGQVFRIQQYPAVAQGGKKILDERDTRRY